LNNSFFAKNIDSFAFLTVLSFLLFTVVEQLFIVAIIGALTFWWLESFSKLSLMKTIQTHSKIASTSILVAFLVSILYLASHYLNYFVLQENNIPKLLEHVSLIINNIKHYLPNYLANFIPDDFEQIKQSSIQYMKENTVVLNNMGMELGHFLFSLFFGIILGVLVAFHSFKKHNFLDDNTINHQFLFALKDNIAQLYNTFKNFVGAQLFISSINTTFTGIFILVVLPLLGYQLPYAGALVLLTFVFGLIPIVGNLISNSLNTIVALSVSFYLTVLMLVFLIVIHKLEYFLNAKIIGTKIKSTAWETLIMMIIFERIFGLIGIVLAPILYGWIKFKFFSTKEILPIEKESPL
jgi:predicted PurR-regulated permease PerM